jgi:hypothetical protein
MRLFISIAAGASALGLLFVGGSDPSRANTIVRGSPAFVTADTARSKSYFIKFAGGFGSFAIPTLNGLRGTITYDNAVAGEKAKIYTAWGTYGSPPPPSNGGTIVAHLVMRFSFHTVSFTGSPSNSSVTYSKLNPSKTYSFDVWDVTNTPSEVKLENIGSPTSGSLSFESPLRNVMIEKFYAVADLELVQNP